LRGVERAVELIRESGPYYSAAQIAERLGITRAAVDKRRLKGKLLGLSIGRRGMRYPVWQLRGGEVIPGLDAVIEILRDRGTGDFAILQFFSSPQGRLKIPTREALLKGRIEEVKRAARMFGEHGAL
jgi:hypothetical protein